MLENIVQEALQVDEMHCDVSDDTFVHYYFTEVNLSELHHNTTLYLKIDLGHHNSSNNLFKGHNVVVIF